MHMHGPCAPPIGAIAQAGSTGFRGPLWHFPVPGLQFGRSLIQRLDLPPQPTLSRVQSPVLRPAVVNAASALSLPEIAHNYKQFPCRHRLETEQTEPPTVAVCNATNFAAAAAVDEQQIFPQPFLSFFCRSFPFHLSRINCRRIFSCAGSHPHLDRNRPPSHARRRHERRESDRPLQAQGAAAVHRWPAP